MLSGCLPLFHPLFMASKRGKTPQRQKVAQGLRRGYWRGDSSKPWVPRSRKLGRELPTVQPWDLRFPMPKQGVLLAKEKDREKRS